MKCRIDIYPRSIMRANSARVWELDVIGHAFFVRSFRDYKTESGARRAALAMARKLGLEVVK